MDFAFAPGPTAYDRALKNMLAHRGGTTLVDVPFATSLRSLALHLNSHVPPNPLTHIIIGSHGDDNAFMQLQLNGAFGPNTTYEDMVQEVNATTRRCQLEDGVINPRPVDSSNNPITCYVMIKGCRIGMSLPFLNKLKEVINGLSTTTIEVAAPRFFHVVAPQPQGTFEFLYYNFDHISKDPVADKPALVAIMDAKALQDIHGVAITTANWNHWIPRRISQSKDDIQQVRINPTPISGLSSVPAGRYKHATPTILTYTARISSGTLPTTQADRIQLVRDRLHARAAAPGSDVFAQSLVATHAFPFFTRFGYTDIDNMVDSLFWTFSRQDAQTLICTGKRHEYNVNPPVVGPTNNELIFNYYANSSTTTSSRMFTDNDARFFQTT